MPMPTLHRLKSGMQFRPYFFITFLLTALLFGILTLFSNWTWSTSLLISWNIAVSSYLLKTLPTLWAVNHQHILQHAQQQNASKWIILLLVIHTGDVPDCTIVIELMHLPHNSVLTLGHLLLSLLTIISAWFLMHTIFAIHYAHDYYLARQMSKMQDWISPRPNI